MENNEMIKKVKASLDARFKNVINDVDFNAVAETFVNEGGYDENISHKENMSNVLSFIAIGKANNKF